LEQRALRTPEAVDHGNVTSVPTRVTFSTLNGLRGVAAILVVTLHDQGLMAPIHARSGYLAVDLFFVLSGFVLAHAYEGRFRAGLGPAGFAAIRYLRFYPLYLVGLCSASSARLSHSDWEQEASPARN
jgi:peptidoglycan/LPS O-acetylase OafA/YrhL